MTCWDDLLGPSECLLTPYGDYPLRPFPLSRSPEEGIRMSRSFAFIGIVVSFSLAQRKELKETSTPSKPPPIWGGLTESRGRPTTFRVLVWLTKLSPLRGEPCFPPTTLNARRHQSTSLHRGRLQFRARFLFFRGDSEGFLTGYRNYQAKNYGTSGEELRGFGRRTATPVSCNEPESRRAFSVVGGDKIDL